MRRQRYSRKSPRPGLNQQGNSNVSESFKNNSEGIKNVVTTIAIIVAGAWTYFNWDTLLPKSNAEILSSAATIRTDVKGSLNVQIGNGAGGIFHDPDRDQKLSEVCANDQSTTNKLVIPLSARLELQNTSSLPVRTTISNFRIQSSNVPGEAIVFSASEDYVFEPYEFEEVGRIDGPESFIAGLQSNRIEAGQEISSSILLKTEIPFGCSETEKILQITSEVDLVGVDPVTDQDLANSSARKVFASFCQVTLGQWMNCNLVNLEAFGH